MTRLRTILFSAAVTLLSVAGVKADAPSPLILPGLWEVTIKTELNGGGPTTIEQICISQDQADHPEPPTTKKNADCQITGGLTGNRSKYRIKCGRKNATSDAEFTYSGDRYEGVITIKNDEMGEIRQVYTAKRIGDCDTTKD
jgi:hypothetical protein